MIRILCIGIMHDIIYKSYGKHIRFETYPISAGIKADRLACQGDNAWDLFGLSRIGCTPAKQTVRFRFIFNIRGEV